MQDTNQTSNYGQDKLINKTRLLAEAFEESSRPSLRWLNYQIAARNIPFVKIGGRVFFNLSQVRSALEKKNTVHARN